MDNLTLVAQALETGANEIHVDEAIRRKALRATQRMLDFAESLKKPPGGD